MCKSLFSLLILTNFFLTTLSAQDERIIDSLETAVLIARNDVEKYNSLHALAARYIDAGNEKMSQVVKEAEGVALKSGDTLCVIKSRRLKGAMLYRLGMPEEAIATVRPLLNNPDLPKYRDEQLGALNTVAISHLVLSKFDSCLKYQFQTLQAARKWNDSEYAAISLMNIGVIYYKLKNYKKALSFMIRSYEIQDSLKIVDFSAPMNISLCNTYLGNFDISKEFLTKSLDACGIECLPKARLHISYASGCLSFAQHEYGRAEHAFLASLELSKELKDFRLFLDNICMLAKIYIHKSELATARVYLEKAEEVIASGAPFNMEKIKIFEQLAQLYLQLKDFEKASMYQGKYITLKDSIYNEVVTANLVKIEAELLEKENQSRIRKQQAVISENEQTIQRQTMLNAIAALLSIMLIASMIFLYRSYRLKKDMNVLLEQRVRQRTSELEREVGGMMKELKENEFQMRRFIQTVGEVVNSLKGLSSITSRYMHGSDAQLYASKVDETIDRLEKITCLPRIRNVNT